MKHEIVGNPEYGQLTVHLDPGDVFDAEAGSMAWMDNGMVMKSKMMGGVGKALVRKLVGGESLFVGEYNHPHGGSATFSPAVPGAVHHRALNGDTFILTGGAYMASTPGVNLKMKFGGLKSFFSGEGAFQIECGGHGDLFFNSFGAMLEKEINGTFTIDTGHVVAWEPSLDYQITGMGSLKKTLLSGEGLVMKFSGQGKVYVQTRTLKGFAGWLAGIVR